MRILLITGFNLIFLSSIYAVNPAKEKDFPEKMTDTIKTAHAIDKLYSKVKEILSKIEPEKDSHHEMKLNNEQHTVKTTHGKVIHGGLTGWKPIGEIRYDIKVKAGEGYFSYYINNFMFLPYKQNRYGRYEPDKTEKKFFKENEEDIEEEYKKTAMNEAKKHIKMLKNKLGHSGTKKKNK